MCLKIRLLLCPAILVALVSGRPEPPTGYSYPSPSIIENSLGSAQNSYPSQFLTQKDDALTPTTNFVNIGSGSLSGYPSDAPTVYPSGPGIIASGPSLVHKHVYVHVAPEEPEEHRPQRPIVIGAPQKHYKIIFIKAPSPPKPVAPIIAPQVQNEEKTLVYVLVKKPEETPEISIPTPIPTKPSKPEVYFIKYNAKKEVDFRPNLGGSSVGQTYVGPTKPTSLSGPAIKPSGESLVERGGNSVGLSSKYGPPGYQR